MRFGYFDDKNREYVMLLLQALRPSLRSRFEAEARLYGVAKRRRDQR